MINSAKVVAILRGITAEEAIEHVACLLEYGINTLEITTNSPGWDQSVQQISHRS